VNLPQQFCISFLTRAAQFERDGITLPVQLRFRLGVR
jgi:hypothetical protein